MARVRFGDLGIRQGYDLAIWGFEPGAGGWEAKILHRPPLQKKPHVTLWVFHFYSTKTGKITSALKFQIRRPEQGHGEERGHLGRLRHGERAEHLPQRAGVALTKLAYDLTFDFLC